MSQSKENLWSDASEFQEIKDTLLSYRFFSFAGILFFLFLNVAVASVACFIMAVATTVPQESDYTGARIAIVMLWGATMMGYVVLRLRNSRRLKS